VHRPRRIVQEETAAIHAARAKTRCADAPDNTMRTAPPTPDVLPARAQDNLFRIMRRKAGCCSPKTLKCYQLRRGRGTAAEIPHGIAGVARRDEAEGNAGSSGTCGHSRIAYKTEASRLTVARASEYHRSLTRRGLERVSAASRSLLFRDIYY
jgi:hypothetical protein